jgi:hypothetical protein
METPKISEKFTLEDIRNIRNYNSIIHLEMTNEAVKCESEELIKWFNEKYPTHQLQADTQHQRL